MWRGINPRCLRQRPPLSEDATSRPDKQTPGQPFQVQACNLYGASRYTMSTPWPYV